MNEEDQILHFSNELTSLINRFRTEYEISYAAVLGVLQMKIHLLCREADELNNNS